MAIFGVIVMHPVKRTAGEKLDLRENLLDQYGTLQGQRIKGKVSLNFDYYDRPKMVKFFGIDTEYIVVLECDDSKNCMWVLKSFESIAS